MPVPNDFDKASFAANLFAKKFVLSTLFLENLSSLGPKVLFIKFWFLIKGWIRLLFTTSTPIPNIFFSVI